MESSHDRPHRKQFWRAAWKAAMTGRTENRFDGLPGFTWFHRRKRKQAIENHSEVFGGLYQNTDKMLILKKSV